MNRTLATLGLFLVLCTSAHGSTLPPEHLETVESYLKNLEVRMKASEYEKARSYITGDLNDDGSEDLAVQFTLEGIGGGGNNYSFFLAVFLKTDDGLSYASAIVTGGKSSRSLKFESVEKGVMTFRTLFHTITPEGKWDASCCPSGIGKAYYALVRDELVELNTAEAIPIDFRRLKKDLKKRKQ